MVIYQFPQSKQSGHQETTYYLFELIEKTSD